MDYTNKGYLDSLKAFKENFATPIQLYNDADCASRFRKVTAPFMMRRMKTDKSIIADLPDKIELDDYASLKSEQAALYEKTLEAAMSEIEGISTTDHESLFKRQGLILQMILALKQICNHPAQFLKNGDCRTELSGKAEMLLDRIEGIVGNGERYLYLHNSGKWVICWYVSSRSGPGNGRCFITEGVLSRNVMKWWTVSSRTVPIRCSSFH